MASTDAAAKYPKRISIIGSGRVGTTLARLFHRNGVYQLGELLCRSQSSAKLAVERAGGGIACNSWQDLQASQIFLLAVPDDMVRRTDERLAATGLIGRETIVFHCSGSLTADELEFSTVAGAAVASIHPLLTFAEPVSTAERFSGTSCFTEGDDTACAELFRAFERIGAVVRRIEPSAKPLYHAALVFASNYLLALLNVSERLLVTSGVDSSSALELLRPLVEATVSNGFSMGLPAALTGPVVRGDVAVVSKHIEELGEIDPQLALLYRFLGLEAAKLTARRGIDSKAIESILER